MRKRSPAYWETVGQEMTRAYSIEVIVTSRYGKPDVQRNPFLCITCKYS